ncbi:hypothetical protein AAFF_G00211130 [Aldrovandia affinis]|uniref:Uncharacterized protein n=1 Tax=Aldrovandia affinis TaxID=143900 RepID=A0AAD7SWG1_9TELE|nr:hypothetical protein AAFF_G00211130 [Aldrovandia affinis]
MTILPIQEESLEEVFGAVGAEQREVDGDVQEPLPVPDEEENEEGGGCPYTSPARMKAVQGPPTSLKRQRRRVRRSKPVFKFRGNIVGCVIQHNWKGDSVQQWKGTVLYQVPVNPYLYLIKYDGLDCIYGLELHNDERVEHLEVLPDRITFSRSRSALVKTLIGKTVEQMFETEDGSKYAKRGLVLARAPIMKRWFYITYAKEPALFMHQLLDVYKKGDLRIMPDSNDSLTAEREPGEVVDSLVGKHLEYTKEDGTLRTGMIIHQTETKPYAYFIKFDDDLHIYVYNLVMAS